RRYSHGALAPHVVGRCKLLSREMWDEIRAEGRDYGVRMAVSEIGRRYLLSDSIGAAGIERAYEDLLRGTRGYREKQLIFHTLRVERQWTTTPPRPGADVYLALKADYQAAANEALKWAAEESDLAFTKGALVILDVRTGAILAAATYPSYDRERLSEDYYRRLPAEDNRRPLSERRSPLTFSPTGELLPIGEDYYRRLLDADRVQPWSARRSPLMFRPTMDELPTGSVYKLITAIAGLEERKITPQTSLHCARGARFHGRWFRCTSTHGNIQLVPAIEGSCNAYFFQTAERLSGDDLAGWGEKFGMAVATGVEIAESDGQMPSRTTRRSRFGRMNLAIGQGDLKCTPLQVARMCAAIANGGMLVRPHFFNYAVDAEGTVVDFQAKPQPTGVRPETLRVVREGMRRVVVGERGTARRAGLGLFRAAGKTGTAELGRGMSNHCWFAGFAPFEDPEIAFAVVSERVPGGHGGSHAAPILARALATIWPDGMP
ncbi:MAG: penicillin-binding transpeptidase domain-containing protein, partial [Candidatus Brocadiia bacterium]|nr:penicillin-binding transpeptidase domain-containing protein [Candidatus Brocadiia bacterium]